MIRVVLDANLFVSALLKPKSNPAVILELIEKREIELIISSDIHLEIRRVLLYPRLKKLHNHTAKQIDRLLKEFTRFAHFTKGMIKIEAIKADPTGNKYLECAVEGKAEFIVSGDRHLRDVKVFEGIRIVSPAEFIKLIE